jgi:hypothetical protein
VDALNRTQSPENGKGWVSADRVDLRVVYLDLAGNSAGPVWSHLRDVNRTVMTSHIRFSRTGPGRWPWLRVHVAHASSRSSGSRAAYRAWGWGRGGTRYSNTSRRVHTRSVSPARIAGVQGRHCLAEPVALVGTGCGRAWRKLVCGKQKL